MIQFEFVYFSDLGKFSAYPVITDSASEHSIEIDFEAAYAGALSKITALQQAAIDAWHAQFESTE